MLRRFDFVFPHLASYQVAVSVDGANTETRDLTILQKPAPTFVERFRLVQITMFIVTLLLAFGTAYAMTESMVTFGTVGDYVKVVGSAFGISGGASSVATVLSSVRGR